MVASALEHHWVKTNGITLHVVQSGPENGPLAILLHGFPEFWIAWEGQIDALVSAGFRVWIPDQRGYNTSDKPHGIDAYRLELLVQDICGLIAVSGRKKILLLGHDWGGAVAWQLTHLYPANIAGLIVVNAPHPQILLKQFLSNPRQLWKAAYMFLFQVPYLPEYFLARKNYRILTNALRLRSRADTFSMQQMERYRQAWSQPGALNASVNWYRALLRKNKKPDHARSIGVPTLLVWGQDDPALDYALAKASIALCDDGHLIPIADAGHWILHEKPEAVSCLIGDFLHRKNLLNIE